MLNLLLMPRKCFQTTCNIPPESMSYAFENVWFHIVEYPFQNEELSWGERNIPLNKWCSLERTNHISRNNAVRWRIYCFWKRSVSSNQRHKGNLNLLKECYTCALNITIFNRTELSWRYTVFCVGIMWFKGWWAMDKLYFKRTTTVH